MTPADLALVELLRRLDALGYDFVTVTPETHRRVLSRPVEGRDLRDLLGWNRPVRRERMPARIVELLGEAGALIEQDGLLRSSLRVSRVGGCLFLHSAYPTDAQDAVFLGPDTCRFVRFVSAYLNQDSVVGHLVDMGAGSGAGGVCAGARAPGSRITLVDTNPLALRLAAINAAAAGVQVDLAGEMPRAFDLMIANPPYLRDPAARAYRDGGGTLGNGASLRWVTEAARLLRPGGRVLLYTGTAIVDGHDELLEQLRAMLPSLGCDLDYEEIDPDVFGEELSTHAYRSVDRIAAVGAVVTRT